MSVDLPPLPTFLIIGAQKSATRWLRTNLGKHPEVFTADTELSFFNHGKRFRRGPDAYQAQFEGWAGEPIVGEATPGYMMRRHDPALVAVRIQQMLPEVRLIALLRNPIDRAESALAHHIKRKRIRRRTSLLEYVSKVDPTEDRLGLVGGGWYAEALSPYVERFGDRLLVLLHDDVREDPVLVYRLALEHVGASADHIPPDLGEVVFSNRPERSSRRAEALEDRIRLWDLFSDDVRRLEELISRDLSAWDPTSEKPAVPATPEGVLERWRQGLDWSDELVRGLADSDLDMATRDADRCVADVVADVTIGLNWCRAMLTQDTGVDGLLALPADEPPLNCYRHSSGELRAVLDRPLLTERVLSFWGSQVTLGFAVGVLLVIHVARVREIALAVGAPDDASRDLLEFLDGIVQRAEGETGLAAHLRLPRLTA